MSTSNLAVIGVNTIHTCSTTHQCIHKNLMFDAVCGMVVSNLISFEMRKEIPFIDFLCPELDYIDISKL